MIEKCKVFTPKEIVMQMLDLIDYREDLFGKKILENSCGDGNFIVQIAERYIQDCQSKNFNLDKIISGLENDIVGVELDIVHRNNCIKNLEVISQKYGIDNVKWNIINADKLKFCFIEKFDFVVGNPPYINYAELPLNERAYIKESYLSCKKGKPDYYYAFTEDAMNSLSKNGKMIYLIPNNFFKNRFGNGLRKEVLPSLKQIFDFTGSRLFKSRMTSSAMILIDKAYTESHFYYKDMQSEVEQKIKKNVLSSEDKWTFSRQKIKSKLNIKFGDIFTVAHGVATLRNNIYVFTPIGEDEKCWHLPNGNLIEKKIAKKAIKPANIEHRFKQEYVIFPYAYEKGVLINIEEKLLQDNYPAAYKYLLQNKKELLKRDSDASADWFRFGRSQALKRLNCEKLVMGLIISEKVKSEIYDNEVIPYSGVFITPKNNEIYGLEFAKEVLETDKFLKYVQGIGISSDGVSYRITSNDISNYLI